MRKILFAGYSVIDFSMISPLFPLLGAKGYEAAILNRYDLAPTRRQLRGLSVFQPPDVSGKLLSAGAIEREVTTFLDTSSIQHLIPLWRGRTPGLKYLAGWSDYYFDFALETIHRYEPDLIVVSLGEAETSIIRRVCSLTARKYACLVPQRYEFKSIEAFEGQGNVTYMVAGEFGKARLIRKGIKPESVVVTGNPRFDGLASSGPGAAYRGADKTILYTLQGVRDESRLFQLLRRYLSSRHGVRLVLRPHPGLPRRSCLPFVRHMIGEPVSLALRGTLGALLRSADVLVTLWSLTILEALTVGLPVISWKSDFLPEEMPFASRGDTMPAHSYVELEKALDQLLFEPAFRSSWVERHQDCHTPYTGVLDGKAAQRVADTIEALVEGAAIRGAI